MRINVPGWLARFIVVAIPAALIACGGGGSSGAGSGGEGTGTSPVITAQPLSSSVVPGGKATFAVTATGSATLTYQWLRDGAPIAGATLPMYVTSALTSADNGAKFSVIVSNGLGSVASSEAILVVGPNLGYDLVHLVYYSVKVFAGGATPLAVLVDDRLAVVDKTTAFVSGGVNATLNGGALPGAGQTLPLSATLAGTFSDLRDSTGAIYNGYTGSSSIQYTVNAAVNPFDPNGQPVSGSASVTSNGMHVVGSTTGLSMDIDYTANGQASATFTGSSGGPGTDLTQTSTVTPAPGSTLAEAASGLKATYGSGSITVLSVASPVAGSSEGLMTLTELKVTYSALTFSVGGISYVANGSYTFQPGSGTSATGSGEVLITQGGATVGRIFADNNGVHFDINGQVYNIL